MPRSSQPIELAVRKYKTQRGELYMAKEKRFFQKVQFRSYLLDKQNKVEIQKKVKEFFETLLLLVDVLLELQSGLKFHDVPDLQVLQERDRAGAWSPALDAPEPDVAPEPGPVEAGRADLHQHHPREAPHGQAGVRLQRQDRGDEGGS